MTSFNSEESLMNETEFKNTFNEDRQKSVKKFSDDLNPLNAKDRPLYLLSQMFKKFSIDGDEILESLKDNPLIQFLNPEYLGYAIIFNDEGGDLEEFAQNNGLDLADFIRYVKIQSKLDN